MAVAQDAVDLARTLRSSARIRTRQPLARAWLALPDRGLDVGDELLAIIADEINVKSVVVIADDSDLVERRVKPLLPKIGKRLGAAIPAVMAAARDGRGHVRRGRLGHARRRDPGGRRGRDPGVAATGHGRRRPRRAGHGHRHRADARAARRGRCPRAAARDPGPPQGGGPRARRPDRPVGRGPGARGRGPPAARGRRRRSPILADRRRRRPTARRSTVALECGHRRRSPCAAVRAASRLA